MQLHAGGGGSNPWIFFTGLPIVTSKCRTKLSNQRRREERNGCWKGQQEHHLDFWMLSTEENGGAHIHTQTHNLDATPLWCVYKMWVLLVNAKCMHRIYNEYTGREKVVWREGTRIRSQTSMVDYSDSLEKAVHAEWALVCSRKKRNKDPVAAKFIPFHSELTSSGAWRVSIRLIHFYRASV